MYYRNFYYVGLFCICIIFFLSSCAPSIRVPILKPAEINLRGINNIAIGNISGNIGPSVADILTSRLFESEKFTVVDRQNLDRIMREHQLNLSGAVDQETAAKMGELTGAACLIIGNARMKYRLNRRKGKARKDKEGKWHQTHKVEGIAKVISTLKVIGLTTGKILAVKTIKKEASDSDWETDSWPADPDKDSIVSSAVNDMIDAFMKMIAPYTVYIKVKFEKSDLPESESAINFAQQGLWKDALEQFKLAKNKAPTEPGLWYNLGIGYEYNYMYRQAIEAFKEANKIEPSSQYIDEIRNVKYLRAERLKLEQQGVINPDY